MERITLEESQLLFENIDLLKNFLVKRYGFSDWEIEIILSSSCEPLKEIMLIDIIYNTYLKLCCLENKNDNEMGLYDKILKILNDHITAINFRDKNSKFIGEFEYALLHYDRPDFGNKAKDGNKRK